MKIIISGDTHMNLPYCQFLVKTAKLIGCDRVFVVGDFGYWEHQYEGIAFLDKLNTFANILNVQVYFLDGNHDKTSLLLEKYQDSPDAEGFLLVRPYIRYAPRGHRWTWDNCRFIALGGAYSVDKFERLSLEARHPKYGGPESLWFPEEEMSDGDMDQILENQDQVNVILAHDKPRGSNPDWNRKDFVGCLPNQDRLQRAVLALGPRYFFHGHLHYAYEDSIWHGSERALVKTTVIGLDCDAGEQAKAWRLFDTEAAVPQREAEILDIFP